MVSRISDALEATHSAATAPQSAIRLHLTGSTPLASFIRRDPELVKTEAERCAQGIGNCFIDKVETSCDLPGAAGEPGADPVRDLRAIILDNVVVSDGYKTRLADMMEELRNQLPPELKRTFWSDPSKLADIRDDLAREGVEDVLAAISRGTAEAGER